jgi:hypothetical protein
MDKTRTIKSPKYKFEIDKALSDEAVSSVKRGWKPCGSYIQLVIDPRGYLVDEPRLLDGTKVEIHPGSSVYPPNGSLKDYRVRLFKREDDPDVVDVDPVGCRLIGGVWRC